MMTSKFLNNDPCGATREGESARALAHGTTEPSSPHPACRAAFKPALGMKPLERSCEPEEDAEVTEAAPDPEARAISSNERPITPESLRSHPPSPRARPQAEFLPHDELVLWEPDETDDDTKRPILVPPVLCQFLRAHQREGVQFTFECGGSRARSHALPRRITTGLTCSRCVCRPSVMGLRPYEGSGCILADDMGLGKTLQSITVLYTLLQCGFNDKPIAKRAIVVCPCRCAALTRARLVHMAERNLTRASSLVKNWANEFDKWVNNRVNGDRTRRVEALALSGTVNLRDRPAHRGEH